MERVVLQHAGMVRLTITFSAPNARAQELLEALRFLMLTTRFEPGCLECSVWVDPETTVHYMETWATEADMRRRVRDSRFTSLLALMESVREAPVVRFDFVANTRGLDYVAEIRHEYAD